MTSIELRPFLICVLLSCCGVCLADGIAIDKIYHPYIQSLEQDLEWRSIYQDKRTGVADHTWLNRLAYGRSLNDRWFAEAYLVGKQSADQGFELKAYELEARWQLTEQGEYWADWGLLFELEHEYTDDIWEFAAAVLAEKEWGKWSGTANFYVLNERGSGIKNELETQLSLQARYRYSMKFEPALELYSGQNTLGMGPVLLGQFKLGKGRRLGWEVGAIFGLDGKSADQTLRCLLEFEF